MTFRRVNWNKDDLSRRLCHALNFAELALKRLALRGYIDKDQPGNSVRAEKVISETAFLLFAASTAVHSEEVSARINSVAQLLIPHARSERMLLGVCLEPALALDYAQAHICLKRLGYPDRDFDELLQRSGLSQAHAGRERTPHRLLEQEWLREGSTSQRSKRISLTARRCVLNWPMDLLGGSREDFYAFTHALMYVTDFNVCHRRLPRPRLVILEEAGAALARCLDEEDYDLAGEILLAWPLTGRSWSAASVFGFRVLAHVEDQAGFLPAASTRLASLARLEADDRLDYFVATAYHTVFVMGLLCAVALQSGRTPPATLPTNCTTPGCADWLLHVIDADGKKTHWREEVNLLDKPERDALAGFLLNVAVHRRVRTRDFSGVHELLDKAYRLGMANTPSSSQAAEMLERIATFARIRSAPCANASEDHFLFQNSEPPQNQRVAVVPAYP
jgi:hypothetical protein